MPRPLSAHEQQRCEMVDDWIYTMMREIVGSPIPHDPKAIEKIRATVETVLCDEMRIITKQQFYPRVEETDGQAGDQKV